MFLGGLVRLACGGGVEVGQALAEALAIMGPPEREVNTSRGSVMFFGRTLIEIDNGIVSYVSVTPGGKRREPAKPVTVRVNVLGDAKAEKAPSPPGEQVQEGAGLDQDGVSVNVGLPTPRGDGWSSLALVQNRLELVARLKRSLLMESYFAVFRPYGTVSKSYDDRKDLSCHDIRDKTGDPMKCYGQDLEIRDPALADLQTQSTLGRPADR